jgi:hypothetical protein
LVWEEDMSVILIGVVVGVAFFAALELVTQWAGFLIWLWGSIMGAVAWGAGSAGLYDRHSMAQTASNPPLWARMVLVTSVGACTGTAIAMVVRFIFG